MASLRTLCSHRLYTLLKSQIPNPPTTSSLLPSTFSNVPKISSLMFQRNFSSLVELACVNVIVEDSVGSQSNGVVEELENNKEVKGGKSWDGMGKRGTGLSEKFRGNEFSEERLNISSSLKEIQELKMKLNKLERELQSMRENVGTSEKKKKNEFDSEVGSSKGREEKKSKKKGKEISQSKPSSLYSMFASKPSRQSSSMSVKDSSEKREFKRSLYTSFTSKPSRQSSSMSVKNSSEKKESKPSSIYTSFTSKPSQRSSSMSVKDSSEQKEAIVVKKGRVSSIVRKEAIGVDKERISSIVRSKPFKKNTPVTKVLSPEMVSLVSRWYEEGYLNTEKLTERKELDGANNFNSYPRDLLRFTAEKFGQDNQEIAKWLSGTELKRVALLGCPSLEKKSAFAAKRLRSFFRIQEDIVCRACKLKSSCKLVNQRVWDGTDHLNLADVMRVLTSYELNLVATQLEVPDEVKVSISKLLKEVVNLSK